MPQMLMSAQRKSLTVHTLVITQLEASFALVIKDIHWQQITERVSVRLQIAIV